VMLISVLLSIVLDSIHTTSLLESIRPKKSSAVDKEGSKRQQHGDKHHHSHLQQDCVTRTTTSVSGVGTVPFLTSLKSQTPPIIYRKHTDTKAT